MARKHIFNPHGFTLVELLTTIAITGVVMSLVIPALGNMREKNAMVSATNLFLAQLHLARSTAITREKSITLCPTPDNLQCSSDFQAWGSGYLIFEDSNKNQRRDAQEPIISVQENTAMDITIVSSSAHRNSITFLAQGRAWFSNTTVRICHQQQTALNRSIIISNNGRVRVEKTMADGSPVTCQ